jgi:putative ABC transport system permease protein
MQSFSDILGQVFRAIAANKLRTFLTMFGIAWGVGSLLVLVGLGEGFRSGQHRQMSTLGNDIIMMFNGTIPAVANQHTGMRPYELTLGDEAALRRLPELRATTVELGGGDLYEVSEWSNMSGRVFGVEPNYSSMKLLPMGRGRFLDDTDEAERRRVAVSGFQGSDAAVSRQAHVGRDVHHQLDHLYRDWRGEEDTAAAPTTTATKDFTSPSPPCRSCSR